MLSLPSKFFSSRVGQTKGKVGAPSVGGGDTDEDEDEDDDDGQEDEDAIRRAPVCSVMWLF